MPPPGYEPFVGAIREQPDDDTVRLACADWLDENGDPDRAAFIRVQCRLASLGHGPMWPTARTPDPKTLDSDPEPEAARLVRRQAELWVAHRSEWLGELPDLPDSTVLFHRGFASVVAVTANPGGLIRNGAALVGVAPVRRIVLRDCTPDAVEVTLLQPWLDLVRGLTVRWTNPQPGSGNRVAEVLGRSRHHSGLAELALSGSRLSNASAHKLAAAPFLPRLAKLDLAGNGIGDAGALAIASAVDPARLRVLDLSGNPLSKPCRANLRRKLGDRVYVEGDEVVG